MEKNKRFQDRINRPYTRSIRSPSPKTVPDMDSENSPLQITCTQESNIDVVWDWNSPQAKRYPRKCQKRLLTQSPKVPLKRHPSSNSAQDFEKLRQELQSLKNQLALPDHEESLQLSPVEEAEYKTFTSTPMDAQIQDCQEDFDELDDGLNEQLFACSQQIEENLKYSNTRDNPSNNKRSPIGKFSFKKTSPREKALANDSFDELLKDIDIKKVTRSLDRKDFLTEECMFSSGKPPIQTNSGKVEFHRTQSFEIANRMSSEILPKICTQGEIERKRKEALARLESKKKLDKTFVSSQCSMKEIEDKRLQALAKVEAKRQQDIIERKRQEALKILEMKRQKNAEIVKSSLVARLK